MLMLLLFAGCAETCGEGAPAALYGAKQWIGEPGIAWFATFEGPGSLCSFACDSHWATGAIVLDDKACIDAGAVTLEDGQRAGICAVIEPDIVGRAVCTLETPDGAWDFEVLAQPDGE